MKKIVAFAGSPRRDGYSWTLLEQLIKGAESADAAVTVYNLNAPGMRGCQGCYQCRSQPGCVVNDPLKPAYADIAAADAVVVTSPIYLADISGQAKMWLDRMFSMLDGGKSLPPDSIKRAAIIISQSDARPDRFEPAIKRLQGFMRVFGWQVEKTLVCSGVAEADYAIPESLLEEAHHLGRQLVR